MKKTIMMMACFAAFVSMAFSQGAGSRNAYVDSRADFERSEKVEQEKTTTYEIIIPDGFDAYKDKKYMSDEIVSAGGSMRLEFYSLYDEVRIYYTCMMVAYDRGEAMNAVLGALQDFTVLTEFTTSSGESYTKDKYYHYKYVSVDREKYYKDDRGVAMALYISNVRFNK